MLTAELVVKHLGLQPLPLEGGYYIQSYRSSESIAGNALPDRYNSANHLFGGAIYYLLTDHPDSFSALHKLKTDELYHFYLGDPVQLTMLTADGAMQLHTLGQNLFAHQHVQLSVPHGVWQGSRLIAGGKFALLGTTMAPAFEPEDYVHGERAALLSQYPNYSAQILELTRW